jgi:hypothetical protein
MVKAHQFASVKFEVRIPAGPLDSAFFPKVILTIIFSDIKIHHGLIACDTKARQRFFSL